MRLEIIGIALILFGMLVLILASITNTNVEYGGVVMIGPIPIVFGNSKIAVLTAIGIAVLIVISILIFNQIRM